MEAVPYGAAFDGRVGTMRHLSSPLAKHEICGHDYGRDADDLAFLADLRRAGLLESAGVVVHLDSCEFPASTRLHRWGRNAALFSTLFWNVPV
jgi:hypothetical protein